MLSRSPTAMRTDQQIKAEPLIGDELMHDIKSEPVDGDDTKVSTESLYTSKGLQASYTDLDQLFDEENSDGSPQLGVSGFYFGLIAPGIYVCVCLTAYT